MKSQSATSNTVSTIVVFWLTVVTSAKLFGLISVPWWIVALTLPLWGPALIFALAIVVLAIAYGYGGTEPHTEPKRNAAENK